MIEVVIFDVGGVLVKDAWVKTVQTLLNDPSLTKESVFELWQSEACFHKFETGQLSESEFITEAKRALNINMSDQAFKLAFNEMIIEPFEHTDYVLNKIKSKYRLGILSNTNPIHFTKIEQSFNVYQHCDVLSLLTCYNT